MTQADADARHAWALAFSLGGQATPDHTNAIVSLLLEHVEADITRLDAAAAVCRSRHLPDRDDGHQQAELLIGHARGVLTAAQADGDPTARARLREQLYAQSHPGSVPYEWDHRRRRRPRWWLRSFAIRHLKIRLVPARSPAGVQRAIAELGRGQAGRMLYQACEECRLGLVGKITTDSAYQGLGIGTRLVLNAFARYPFYAWHTTTQYPTSGTFWANMARRSAHGPRPSTRVSRRFSPRVGLLARTSQVRGTRLELGRDLGG